MNKALHDTLTRNADDLTFALTEMSKSFFAPEDTKTLRDFSSTEVTELLGVSESYLRKARHEGRIPEMPPGPGNRRRYTARQIWELRQLLAKGSKNPHHMLPGRKAGDKLQVWSTVNFKGGSAKTTTTITLAQRLALRGYRVLCVDADPQASLTTFFGYQPEIDFFEGGTLYDAIRYRNAETGEGPKRLSEIVRKSYFHNLDIVPGGIMLSEFEHETPTALSRVEQPVFFQRIASALDDVEADYDIVLIDCPPQLGYVTLSAICASTSLLMTVIPDRIDIASAAQFLRMAAGLVEVLSDSGGITDYDNFLFLLTRFDTAISAQQDLAEYMRALFKDQVLETPFLKSSAISDAGLGQRTVFEAEVTHGTRRTYDRAIQSAIGVCDDVERRIQAAWGRTP